MKKLGILIFIAALIIGISVANAFSWGRVSTPKFSFNVNFGGVKGSGVTATEKRAATGFKRIEAGGMFEIEAVAQKDFAVEVDADDNLLQYVQTEVSGDTLEIRLTRKVSTKTPIKIRIAAPSIEAVDISGASRINVADVKGEVLNVELSGASKAKVTGTVNRLEADLSGASQLDAPELKSVDANVDASGASRASVFANGDLTTHLSGASHLDYAGNPTIGERRTSGASSMTAK